MLNALFISRLFRSVASSNDVEQREVNAVIRHTFAG
jgi:hypothetical protein